MTEDRASLRKRNLRIVLITTFVCFVGPPLALFAYLKHQNHLFELHRQEVVQTCTQLQASCETLQCAADGLKEIGLKVIPEENLDEEVELIFTGPHYLTGPGITRIAGKFHILFDGTIYHEIDIQPTGL